jgi:hypothetical protein
MRTAFLIMFNDDLDRLFEQLAIQWNIAEGRIKKAEQVRGGEVVSSAIFELRYAGRKLIDAFELLRTTNWKENKVQYDQIHRFLEDALEDCVKAKHDAIDSMLDFVVHWMAKTEMEIGPAKLQELFPSFLETTAKIESVQDKIAHSRQHRLASRNGSRDDIYDTIEKEEYDEILKLYDTMRRSKNRVQAIVDRQWRNTMLERAAVALGLLIAVVALIYAALDFHR